MELVQLRPAAARCPEGRLVEGIRALQAVTQVNQPNLVVEIGLLQHALLQQFQVAIDRVHVGSVSYGSSASLGRITRAAVDRQHRFRRHSPLGAIGDHREHLGPVTVREVTMSLDAGITKSENAEVVEEERRAEGPPGINRIVLRGWHQAADGTASQMLGVEIANDTGSC